MTNLLCQELFQKKREKEQNTVNILVESQCTHRYRGASHSLQGLRQASRGPSRAMQGVTWSKTDSQVKQFHLAGAHFLPESLENGSEEC